MKKHVSIKEIAKIAKCSISTVSNVLNGNSRFFSEDTRSRVLKAVSDNHYVSNSSGRNLRTGKTETVGVVFYPPNADVFGSEFYINVMRGLQKVLSENGYEMLLSEYTRQFSENALPPTFISRGKVDAVIVLGGFPQRAADAILGGGIPALVLDSFNPLADSILTNGRKATKEAVKYLASKGHKHIEYFLYGNDDYNSAMRAKGFLDGVKDCGLDKSLCAVHNNLRDNFGAEREFEEMMNLGKRPTAVMGVNDSLSTFLMERARSHGLEIPKDMAFFGFDDVALARRSSPALSTIHVDTLALGELGARTVLERIKNPEAPLIKKVFTPTAVYRAST